MAIFRIVLDDGSVNQVLQYPVGTAERFPDFARRGQHWRATVTGIAIGGHGDDFLGQYHRNSNVQAAIRYSF